MNDSDYFILKNQYFIENQNLSYSYCSITVNRYLYLFCTYIVYKVNEFVIVQHSLYISGCI